MMNDVLCITCLKLGSNVGSKNDQVLETTTTTKPVTITAGTLINLESDVDFSVTLQSANK